MANGGNGEFFETIMDNLYENSILMQQNIITNAINQNVQYYYSEEEIPTFVCDKCKKTFYNANALRNHKNMHHDLDGSGSDADNQNKLKINDQNLNGVCDFKFIPLSPDDSLISREGIITKTFTKDTTYLIVKIEGDEMNINAMKRSRLDGLVKRTQIKPKQSVDLRGPFTCTVPSTLRPDMQCRQIFFNCCDYSLHYREEHTKRRKAALRCQVCERRLDRDVYQNNSLAAQLQASFTLFCRICGMTFRDSLEFNEHNRLIHTKVKPHQCRICAKRFTQQGGLQQHMRMHSGIRPFACTFCPKAFTQKAGLDQHLRTHTKVKPFKCVICGKSFSQSVHLRQHMRTHTNIQPFECSVCGRRFKQSSHLNFHIRSHVTNGSLSMESYAQSVDSVNQIEFLNLANLQPVQDGETLYYAAELASDPQQTPFDYQPQDLVDNSVATGLCIKRH